MHALYAHVPEFLNLQTNIAHYTQQGMEKYNDRASKDYFRSTNHRGIAALKQLFLKKNRIQYPKAAGHWSFAHPIYGYRMSARVWMQVKANVNPCMKWLWYDPVFKKCLEPIYDRLNDPALLASCLPGKAKNLNESINALVWNKCPKSK